MDVSTGKRLALVGQSGCGKTTMLRVIAGLQSLTSGSIQTSIDHRRTSFVFQQPALLPWRRTLANVTLPLELTANKANARRNSGARAVGSDRVDTAMSALTEVEMVDAVNQFPFQLSGGMKMRVSIARALVTQPDLLLLDEPFAALDDLLRTQLGELVIRLWRTHQFTMVLVTHNIGESIQLSDQIGVMHMGSLVSVIDNPLADRNAEVGNDLRRTPEFAEFYGVVSDELRKVASL